MKNKKAYSVANEWIRFAENILKTWINIDFNIKKEVTKRLIIILLKIKDKKCQKHL